MTDSLENKLLLFTEFTGSAQRCVLHSTCILSSYWGFSTFWKKQEKKNRTQHNQSTSSSHCPQVKIFWAWLLIEGSWEISKTFLGKQGVISKQGLSEPRKLSNRARLVVTNYLWESEKMPESVVAPIRERANTSQLHLFCQRGVKLACTVIKSLLGIRKKDILSDVVGWD